jgi:hypothetical protein|tara:strand:- start:456 stop:788 length:333 start_codon:yes stop_codon:yes gene_type:complete
MKQLSRTRKGKRLQNTVKDKILKSFPHLKPGDVRCATNGENGEDIKLSKTAKKLFSYQVECKNRKAFKTLYGFWKQTCKHNSRNPLLVLKMDKEKPLAIIDLDHFFELVE